MFICRDKAKADASNDPTLLVTRVNLYMQIVVCKEEKRREDRGKRERERRREERGKKIPGARTHIIF
jgi:hypothetical protein